jgi:hypothetical protein|mmetsp:Transcript_45465/g.134562  ORF Transcript_45465/g.134562 Transcript_45465/m.134562 type:complete len:267 (-) Transcript_45465:60-860(-)
MQQALAQAGQGAEPKGADRLRRLLNIGHVAFLLFLFAPPLTLCVAMAAEVNIAYFVGRSAWWAVLIIVTLFLAFAFFRVRRTKPVVLATIWVPAALLALVGGIYRLRAEITAASLESRDCFAFKDKRELQRAYQVADELWESCVNQVILPASVDATPTKITDCPAYPSAVATYGKQFAYLESLESRYQCAGICHRGKRLWDEAGTIAPSCGPFVSQWLYAGHAQASIVLWYSVIVILTMFPAHSLLMMPLFEQYEYEENKSSDRMP